MDNDDKITREELEDNFQALQNDLQSKISDKKNSIATVLAIGGSVVVIISYLLGRRRGRKSRSVVEIRRG